MIEPLITVSHHKQTEISEILWTEWEKIYVMIEAKFELPNEEPEDGYFLVTLGCFYFFTKRIIGRPEFIAKYSLLDCKCLHLSNTGDFELEFENSFISIKTHNGPEIAYILINLLNQLLYDLPEIERMKIHPPLNEELINFKKRPLNLLRNRCLLFAHYYDYYQPYTGSFDYFDKWEKDKDNVLYIGNHFHAERYSTAIGHAISWESEIDTVNFQNFIALGFSKILSTILENSIHINKIVFSYYDEEIPILDIKHVHENKILKFWFLKCNPEMIINFFNKSTKGIPNPINEINISGTEFKKKEFEEFINGIIKFNSTKNLKKIRLSNLTFKKFPFENISNLINNTEKLQSLIFSKIEIDCTKCLEIICKTPSNLKSIIFDQMSFESIIDFKNINLPSKLLLFSVNFSTFTPESFLSLIQLITFKKVFIPFIFQAQALDITPQCYQKLTEVDWSKCYPNLCEIDWSGNSIPKLSSINFFEFLFTQKLLRNLILYNIYLKNTMEFWKNLIKLVISIQLPGLSVGGKFPGSIFLNLIKWLGEATFLRRLQLRCPSTHDEGLIQFSKIIQNMPNLNEVMADGFRPTKIESLIEFWSQVNKHPTIHACDLPEYDMKVLKLKKKKLPKNFQEIYNNLLNKSRPSTINQRVEFMIQIIEERLEQFNPKNDINNIFSETANMEWSDDDDNNQEEKMNKKKKKKINLFKILIIH